MITRNVTLPELAMIAGTRVALGAGIGLLVGDRLSAEQRRAVGLTLLTIGALTTIPLAAGVILSDRTGNGRIPSGPISSAGRNKPVAP